MKENRGITLIELVVAIAVGGIVMTGLTAMIVTCVKLYGRNLIHVELQQEAQEAMSFLTASVMEATGLEIIQDETGAQSRTQMVLLGSWERWNDGTADNLSYEGTVVFCMDNTLKGCTELYIAEYAAGSMEKTDSATAKEELAAAMLSDVDAHREEYLLATGVNGFQVTVADMGATDVDGSRKYDDTAQVFSNPVNLQIAMSFTKSNSAGEKGREITEKVRIRNRLEQFILYEVKDSGAGVHVYNRKK